MNEIRHNFKCVSVHTFLSAYFVISVSEISKDLHKKASINEKPKSLWSFCLVTKFSILLVKIYIIIVTAWIRIFKNWCHVKVSRFCFCLFYLSFYMFSVVAGAFYGLDHYTIRSPLCLCGSHETPQLLVHKWLKFSVFTTCIWLENLSSVALE